MDTIFQTIEALGLSGGDADTEVTLGAPPGADGLPGIGILSISPLSANVVRITLTDASHVDLSIPAGQPGDRGRDGVTPTFVAGNISIVAYNGTPGWTVRTTSTPNVYAIDLSIPQGPPGVSPWTTPASWATFTFYTAVAPASCVTLGNTTYVCTTSHTSTGSFDATKWAVLALTTVGAIGPAGPPGAGAAAATGAELRALTSATAYVSPKAVADAQAFSGASGAGSFAFDLTALGGNINLALTGNATLANPTAMKPGTSGLIRVAQDATGGRTLAFGSSWKFPGGTPTASTAANAVDAVAYTVFDASTILASYIKGFA